MTSDEVSKLQAENKDLKKQFFQLQKDFLLQQRVLNMLQMEKLESMEKSLIVDDAGGT